MDNLIYSIAVCLEHGYKVSETSERYGEMSVRLGNPEYIIRVASGRADVITFVSNATNRRLSQGCLQRDGSIEFRIDDAPEAAELFNAICRWDYVNSPRAAA